MSVCTIVSFETQVKGMKTTPKLEKSRKSRDQAYIIESVVWCQKSNLHLEPEAEDVESIVTNLSKKQFSARNRQQLESKGMTIPTPISV